MHRWYQEGVQAEGFNFEYLLTTRLESHPISLFTNVPC
jgi:hypothetical protein